MVLLHLAKLHIMPLLLTKRDGIIVMTTTEKFFAFPLEIGTISIISCGNSTYVHEAGSACRIDRLFRDMIDFLETYFKTVLRGFLGFSYFYYIKFDVHIDLKYNFLKWALISI